MTEQQKVSERAELGPWIVWSNEHRAFWRPNNRGYTRKIEEAGRYTKAEAFEICRVAQPRAGSTVFRGQPDEICMPAPEATIASASLSTSPAPGDLLNRLEGLMEKANEPAPTPTPLPEQDTRVGEAMAGIADNRASAAWRERRNAARREIVNALPTLIEQYERMREALEGIVSAWESLPGGCRYSPKVIESWLAHSMTGAVNTARSALTQQEGTR